MLVELIWIDIGVMFRIALAYLALGEAAAFIIMILGTRHIIEIFHPFL
jgi:hypothetical protein